MTADDKPDQKSLLGRRLRALIAAIPEKERPSVRAIAKTLNERGAQVTASYLGQLVSGKKDNPTTDILLALADYFKTTAGALIDPEPQQEEAQNPRIARVMRRAMTSELSDRGIDVIEGLLDLIVKQEAEGRSTENHPKGPQPLDT